MTTISHRGLKRRRFLQTGAGLVIGLQLPLLSRAQSGAANVLQGDGAAGAFTPNAFVRIAADDTVTVISKHLEFGQGPYTGLATLVAEELDADWSQIRAEAAPADNETYKNFAFGVQGTGGSTSIANSYRQMRQAGAAARAMLVAAAAERWNVAAAEIRVDKGRIRHDGSGRNSGFGAFADAAARQTPPAEPTLKTPDRFVLIGRDLPKLDTRAKTNGDAQFTLDLYPSDDLLTATIVHPPQFGATVAGVDAAAARAVPGVVDVQTVPQGVAVYADSTWAALKGRAALDVSWDDSGAEKRSSQQHFDDFLAAAGDAGRTVSERGAVDDALGNAAQTLEADYLFPFLAHAPMETLDAVVRIADDGAAAEVWMGSQLPGVDRPTIAGILGLPPERVTLHVTFAGGSFGRRAQAGADFAAEAAEVAKAGPRGRPVKLVWTRENDIRGGRYRPLTVHRLRGGVDADGNVVAWRQTVATPSIMAGTPFEAMIQDGIDPTSVEGARDPYYAIPDARIELHTVQTGVPVLWWRSVGHTHTAYAVETFIDELLALAGRDPVDGRLALLGERPRDAAVLRAAAEMAGWGGATGRDAGVPDGRARGVAVHKSFDSYVAQIVELSRGDDGLPRVHKVWCAVDCGIAVNPNVVRAQMEGGIGFGLGAALYDEITLGDDGRVEQGNFDSYRSIRIGEMPAVEVAVLKSDADPTGVGEPGVPPIAPAVANAWRALTGAAVRRLPFAAGQG